MVAARDGIVDSIRTKAGTALVQPGDVVRKGQILIRGEERTGSGVRAVSARGVVMGARVGRGGGSHGLDGAAHIVFRAHGGKRDGRQPVVRPVA